MAEIRAGRFCGPSAQRIGAARVSVTLGMPGEIVLTTPPASELSIDDAGALPADPSGYAANCTVRMTLDPPDPVEPGDTIGTDTTHPSVPDGQRCFAGGQLRNVLRASALNDGTKRMFLITFGPTNADGWCVEFHIPRR